MASSAQERIGFVNLSLLGQGSYAALLSAERLTIASVGSAWVSRYMAGEWTPGTYKAEEAQAEGSKFKIK